MADSTLGLAVKLGEPIRVRQNGQVVIETPAEGVWSVATEWTNSWPGGWKHAQVEDVSTAGDWTIVHGKLDLPQGRLLLTDSYRSEGALIRGVRRFEWTGKETLPNCTLSVRWIVPGSAKAKPLLPGISYFGNPSGKKTNSCVPIQTMTPGEESYYEEHRYPMPFASLEWPGRGAALHSLPSMPAGAHKNDQWWTLGMTAGEKETELALLSGPCASNGKRNVVKARQGEFMSYPDTWLDLRPGMIVEKTFFLQAYDVAEPGTGFVRPMNASIDLFQPFSTDGLPTGQDILRDKLKFAQSRWRDLPEAGFEMYPDYVKGTHYVMGWCGQAEALGYALLALNERMGTQKTLGQVIRSLDLLSKTPFNENGFFQHYDVENKKWSEQDFVSQGQAMESVTRAIELGRRRKLDTASWEAFMRKACDFHAARILKPDWHPISTNEGFLVSPLLRGAKLFGEKTYEEAALKAAQHYVERHRSMAEPYWGGTLDAACEDKEGAWAAFQAFLAVYDATGDAAFLGHAEHAMNVALSYTMVWDVDLPPGRLKDHAFKSRGWTVVSAQNQHLDVFGVAFTPEVYRMGQLLKRPELQKLARVMYRSCGQLIDPQGSQGEQVQHTNFAQAGDMSDVYKLRGGYSEGWTVFWITAHFLHAAARFEEMGVDLDAEPNLPQHAPAPLYRDPIFDGAADPVLVWNPGRKAWWMLYTQRRARLDLPGVEWCHQTEIGIAESRDEGMSWSYQGTLKLPHPDEHYSFWAPDIIKDDRGNYHLFVSYVPGIHQDWGGDRYIFQYTSTDLVDWTNRARLPLTSDRCIDPSLCRMTDGTWRLWYKDEGHNSATFAVESRDLATWKPVDDPSVSKLYGEAPKAFFFKGSYWLLKDPDSGLDVYKSTDLTHWTYQGKILDKPGKRVDDGSIGKHADVVVNGNEATIIYFTHPYGQNFPEKDGMMPFPARRSSIQAAALDVVDGKLVCDRDAPLRVRLGRG